jgi:AAA15 family ATPase/GTPase
MLIGFTLKNFKSFYGKNTFSMKSSADTKFRELNTIKTENGGLIKSAFVFGANGSGKSNLIRAIDCMKNIVLADIHLQSKMIMHIDNFILSETSNETPSIFEVEFIVDEIDSRLHPMLVKFLVMMFNSISKNPKNAQLICTTHNVLLLDEEIRRDQIYFTEKDEYGVSTLYSLTDFKGVRKESKLLKQYLLGAFGATPKIRDFFAIKKA